MPPSTSTLRSSAAAALAPAKKGAGGERARDMVEFETQVVDFFVAAADLLGVPKSVATLYGVVFASPEPLSFSEIEQRVALSKGSISQGLRLLREMGAVKEVSSSADRVERFEPDMEIRRIIRHFIDRRVRKQLETGRERLVALSGSVPGSAGTGGKILRERLKHLQGTHEKARALLPIANTFLQLGR